MKRKLELDANDKCLPFTYDLTSAPQFVTDIASLKRLESSINRAILITIDTERKPVFIKCVSSQDRKTSLLQMGVRSDRFEECFLIDLQILSVEKSLLLNLNDILECKLQDESCPKVGHSVRQDFSEIVSSFPELSAFSSVAAVVDTNELYRTIHPEISYDVALKFLTRRYLHFNLVKTQQISDWSIRPLTAAQIHYAACDAVVLLRLYDEMMCVAMEREDASSSAEESSGGWETSCLSPTTYGDTNNDDDDDEVDDDDINNPISY